MTTSHWAIEAVTFAASRELMNGIGENLFAPAGDTSRAMIFTILARLNGQDTAKGDTWYSAAMDWAVETGVSDGTNPEASITREQLAVMLYRYMGSPEAEADGINAFTDSGKVSDWAVEAMNWAVEAGILRGNENNELNPGGTASRAEVSTMLQRFICDVVMG